MLLYVMRLHASGTKTFWVFFWGVGGVVVVLFVFFN